MSAEDTPTRSLDIKTICSPAKLEKILTLSHPGKHPELQAVQQTTSATLNLMDMVLFFSLFSA